MEELIEVTVTPEQEQPEVYTEIYEQYAPLVNLPAKKETSTNVIYAVAAGAIAFSVLIAWIGAVMTRKAARTILGTKPITNELTRDFGNK